VAVEVPDDAAEALVRWGREVVGACGPWGRRPRVLGADSLHLTLCFLGSRPVDEIASLARALEPCTDFDEGELSFGAPVWLPPRRPRALAIELHDARGRLAELQAAVSQALRAACDWQPRPGRFRPHITVIRSRDGAGAGEGVPPATPNMSFTPAVMILYRSHLERAGASYEALAEYTLTPAAG